MATSKDMDIEGIAPRAREKGLQLVGSGDALHPKWLDIIEESTEYVEAEMPFIQNGWTS